MPSPEELIKRFTSLDAAARDRVMNVAANLQLLADMSYADVTLYCHTRTGGEVLCVAEARPSTAPSLKAESELGAVAPIEARASVANAFKTGTKAHGLRGTRVRGLTVSELAVPIVQAGEVVAVVLRELNQGLMRQAGEMERSYMDIGERLLDMLARAPIVGSAESAYATTRVAGDGIMRVDADARIAYASPNAVSIYRALGFDGNLVGQRFDALGTDESALAEAVQLERAAEKEVYEHGLFVIKRALPLVAEDGSKGAVGIIRDVTDLRRREQQLKVAEATIREVHHRVKNNLQTIASLLRLQARRAESPDVRSELGEAVERISSIAVVHELLAGSAEEAVDFRKVAGEIVATVRQAIVAPDAAIEVAVHGQCGAVPATQATSLALILTELVHNALRHAFPGRSTGSIEVRLAREQGPGDGGGGKGRVRDGGTLRIVVADDGVGLPDEFDIDAPGGLGWQIVKTLATEDLGGTVSVRRDQGTTVTVEVPIE